MIRKLLLVASVAMFGVTAAAAQSCLDSIKARQALMKKSGAAAKSGLAMVKGQAPFDLNKAKEIFATFANDASHVPALFPECSRTGNKTTAAPAIWEKPADFKAAMAKFTADIKSAQQNTKDFGSFKTEFSDVTKNCSNCHQTFRVRKS